MEKYFIDVGAKLIKVPSQRFYETPYGVFPSATTVLSSKAKDGLTSWQINLAKQGLDPKDASRQAMDRGSKVHNACEAWMKGEKLEFFNLETGEENYDLYSEWVPILRFIDFYNTHQVDPVLIEQTIYSPTDKFAGTLDLLCYMLPDPKKKTDKALALIDLKTSTSAFPEYHWQLAAYEKAFLEMQSMNDEHSAHFLEKLGGPKTPELIGILLLNVDTAKGWRLTEVEDTPAKFKNFQACNVLWTAAHKSYSYWKGLYPTTLQREGENHGN